MTKFIAGILFIALVVAGFEGFRFFSAGPGRADQEVVFQVPTGKSFNMVAAHLEAQGLISSAFKMRVLAKLTGRSGKVKIGEYLLDKGMSPQEILSILVSGKSIMYSLTFPEGSSIYDMAAIIDKQGIYKGNDFLAAVHDKKRIQELLGVEFLSLGGDLFPETYKVTRFTPLKDLLTAMIQNFKSKFGQLEGTVPPERSADLLPRHQLVILASMVEKETGAGHERPMIASVFYNRLKKGMRLQSDPTIIYGIWIQTGNYKQNITKDDILRSTPYNTYTEPKLPFGPIANPGAEALEAVLKPATSEYLYFVSHNDGTHAFSKTYEEHLEAVKKYQLDPRSREGKSWRNRAAIETSDKAAVKK